MRQIVGLVALLGAAACGGEERWPFQDREGRACVREEDGSFACEATPAPVGGCAAGETACFTLAYAGGAGSVLQLCDSCCFPGGSTWQPEDCVDVICAVDRDCAVGDAVCVDADHCVRQP